MTVTMNDLPAILGAIDAAFAPIRDFRTGINNLHANAMIARQEYRELGIQWFGGGGTVAERKGAETRLGLLADDGWIELYRKRGRTASVTLTPKGELAARVMAGLSPPEKTFIAMAMIAEKAEREPVYFDDKWVGEHQIEPDQKHLLFLEELCLPGIVAGFITVGATARRNVYYALSPRGWEALDGDEPPVGKTKAKFGEPHRKEYYAAFKMARTRMDESPVGRVGEIGPLPLPVSMEGCRLDGKPEFTRATA